MLTVSARPYYKISEHAGGFQICFAKQKPRGGAKAVLEKIHMILCRINLSDEAKGILSFAAGRVVENYAHKRSLNSFRGKKIYDLLTRISKLALPFPRHIYQLICMDLDMQALGRLARVNRHCIELVDTERKRRASFLGWNKEVFPSAVCFLQHLMNGFSFLGLRLVINRILDKPEMNLRRLAVSILRNHGFFYLENEELNAMLCFLIHKTKGIKQIGHPPIFKRLVQKIYCTSSPSNFLVGALQIRLKMPLDLRWYIRYAQPDWPGAKLFLDLLSYEDLNAVYPFFSSSKQCTLLWLSCRLNKDKWVRWLLAKKVDVDKGDISPLDEAIWQGNFDIKNILTSS